MNKVRIWNYGEYSNDNYGSCRAVQIGDLTLYFSYRTVIAFEDANTGRTIIRNYWGPTTGKHLNWIDPDPKIRLSSEEFNKRLNETLERHSLSVDEA
jgi:hypothetical protein